MSFKKKIGWVGGVSSIQVYFGFLEFCLTLQGPLDKLVLLEWVFLLAVNALSVTVGVTTPRLVDHRQASVRVARTRIIYRHESYLLK